MSGRGSSATSEPCVEGPSSLCRPKELRSNCFLNSLMQTRSCDPPAASTMTEQDTGMLIDVVRFLNLAQAVLFSDVACRSKVSEIR